MLLEEDSDLALCHGCTRHTRHPLVEGGGIDRQLEIVQAQEDQRCRSTRTLVPVDEWMVACDVKQVGGSHLEHVRMKILPFERERSQPAKG